MFFNPLFLQNVGNAEGSVTLKPQKQSGSGYLFSDIINVQSKSENGKITMADLLSGISETAKTERDGTVLENMLKSIAEGLVNIFQETKGTESPEISKGLQNLQDGNLTDKELTKLISFLVGIKTSLVPAENIEVSKDSKNKKLETNKIDISTINDLLGSGKTLSIILGNDSKSIKIDIQRIEGKTEDGSQFKVKLNVSNTNLENYDQQFDEAKALFIVKADLGNGNPDLRKTLYSAVSKEVPAMFKNNFKSVPKESVSPNTKEVDIVSNKNTEQKPISATPNYSKQIVADHTHVLEHQKPAISNNSLKTENYVTNTVLTEAEGVKANVEDVIQNKVVSNNIKASGKEASVENANQKSDGKNKIVEGTNEPKVTEVKGDKGSKDSNVIMKEVTSQKNNPNFQTSINVSEQEKTEKGFVESVKTNLKVNEVANNTKAESAEFVKQTNSKTANVNAKTTESKIFSHSEINDDLKKVENDLKKDVINNNVKTSESNISKQKSEFVSLEKDPAINSDKKVIIKDTDSVNPINSKTEAKQNNTETFIKPKIEAELKTEIKEEVKSFVTLEPKEKAVKVELNSIKNKEILNDNPEKVIASKATDKTEPLKIQNVINKESDQPENLKLNKNQFESAHAELKVKSTESESTPKITKEVSPTFEETINKKTEAITVQDKVDSKSEENIKVNTSKVQPGSDVLQKQVTEAVQRETLNVHVKKAVKNISIKGSKTEVKSESKQSSNEVISVADELKAAIKETNLAGGSENKDFAQKQNSENMNLSNQNSGNRFDEMTNIREVVNNERIAFNKLDNQLEPMKTVKSAEVVKEIAKFIEKQDKTSLVIKVDPEHLGKVKIALEITDKIVKTNIEVENAAAKQMLEANIKELNVNLNQSGTQFGGVNITLANSDNKNAKHFNNKKKNSSNPNGNDDNEKVEKNETGKAKDLGYNTVEYLA